MRKTVRTKMIIKMIIYEQILCYNLKRELIIFGLYMILIQEAE